jgi:hypothetical protein
MVYHKVGKLLHAWLPLMVLVHIGKFLKKTYFNIYTPGKQKSSGLKTLKLNNGNSFRARYYMLRMCCTIVFDVSISSLRIAITFALSTMLSFIIIFCKSTGLYMCVSGAVSFRYLGTHTDSNTEMKHTCRFEFWCVTTLSMIFQFMAASFIGGGNRSTRRKPPTCDYTCGFQGPLWSCSYDSRIYNYLCNQCLSLLTLWIRIPLGVVAVVIVW